MWIIGCGLHLWSEGLQTASILKSNSQSEIAHSSRVMHSHVKKPSACYIMSLMRQRGNRHRGNQRATSLLVRWHSVTTNILLLPCTNYSAQCHWSSCRVIVMRTLWKVSLEYFRQMIWQSGRTHQCKVVSHDALPCLVTSHVTCVFVCTEWIMMCPVTDNSCQLQNSFFFPLDSHKTRVLWKFLMSYVQHMVKI